MALFSPPLTPSVYFLQLQSNPKKPNRLTATAAPLSKISSCSRISVSYSSSGLPSAIRSLDSIKPFLESQWQPILKGWLCSAVSVYSLSRLVPAVRRLSELAVAVDVVGLRKECLALATWFLVRTAATYLQQAFLWDAALSALYKIRIHVFETILRKDLAFFEGRNGVSAGDIAYRITAEASDIADTVYAFLNTIVPCFLQLSALAAQMLVISPALSLISTMVIPSMAFIVAILGHNLRQISKSARLSIADLSSYLNEVMPSILLVKANKSEMSETVRFLRLVQTDCTKSLRKKKMKALIPQIIQIVYFGALCVICIGSMVVSRGSIDYPGVASFITSLVLLIEPIQGVGKAYNELKQGEPAIERLFDLTRFSLMETENPNAVDLPSIKGDVKFCKVSFTYEEGMPLVLDELDLHIQAGETIAIVGPSGGGKTTLMKLLLRLYDPQSGCIMIDDCNIQNIRLESLRSHVGIVSQDITLFSGTVTENIGYRDVTNNIDGERVRFAARTANADEFIETLPEQYETCIGPRGSTLSGGQRQRLAIARALYHNPSILIMDEATSALDSQSELLVRQALQHLMENRTVLIIAHRLDTVLTAERIFSLHDGKLYELNRSSLVKGQHGMPASTRLVI